MTREDLYTVPTDMSLFPIKYKKQNSNFSVRADIIRDFTIYAKKMNLSKSGVVETLLENFLIQAGVREKKA